MNKDQAWLNSKMRMFGGVAEEAMDEYLEDKAVTQKGEAAHPHSVFIHFYAENPQIIFNYGYTIFDIIRDNEGMLNIEILNQPAIFAWQWIKNKNGKAEISDGWLTEFEMAEKYEDFAYWVKIPGTQKKISDLDQKD